MLFDRGFDMDAVPFEDDLNGLGKHFFGLSLAIIGVEQRLERWFVPSTGEDMELNGAKPDYSIWPQPGQMPLGKDIQLEKAVQVLQSQVVAEQKKVKPVLRKASERNY